MIQIGVFVLVSFFGVAHADNFEIKLSSGDAFEVQDSSGTSLMDVLSNGNVGIGTTSPTEKLDVTRNIKASGAITEGAREIKKNCQTFSNGVNKWAKQLKK